MSIFVLDKHKKPLMPCSEKRARLLLERGRARVARRFPFTIRLVDRRAAESTLQPVRVKIDHGSKMTGIAVVRDEGGNKGSAVLFLAELQHRGAQISEALTARRGNLRYRPARFLNRTKPKGWLAPSLQHRVDTTTAWVDRLRRLAPVSGIATELVRFDMQLLENPEISGVGYLTRRKRINGFQTGDIVRAVLAAGVHAGSWIGRVAVRSTGRFNIQTATGVRQGVGWKNCQVLQRADGYGYSTNKASEPRSLPLSLPVLKDRVFRGGSR